MLKANKFPLKIPFNGMIYSKRHIIVLHLAFYIDLYIFAEKCLYIKLLTDHLSIIDMWERLHLAEYLTSFIKCPLQTNTARLR